MSHYANYIRERTSDEIIETEYGFITYRIISERRAIYIIDLYIHPDFRKEGKASALADVVVTKGREMGLSLLLGSVVPSNKGSTASLRVLLAYGMELDGASADFIWFRKDI
jgi:ribosomal protein S18 acetylase RimI-like enzyme